MISTRSAYVVLAGLPGVALAAASLFHPHSLSYDTARTWWVLHVLGMFVFPLVGVAVALLFRGRRDVVAVLVVLGAFVYAVAYSALDIISGIAAGYVTWRLGAGQPRPAEVSYLFDIGGPLGEVGSWALVATSVLVSTDALIRHRLPALPVLLMVPGAWLVHIDHIFSPLGTLGMLLVGLGTGWLAHLVLSNRTMETV